MIYRTDRSPSVTNNNEDIEFQVIDWYTLDTIPEISEDSNLKNNHPYAQSNARGEKQVFQFKDSNKINSKVLRISQNANYLIKAIYNISLTNLFVLPVQLI